MKFISWNVNGLRAVAGKGFADVFVDLDADFFCLQETKLQAGQIDLEFPGYLSYWNYAEKKGYSGTAIYTKHEPLSVRYGIGIDEHDHEGRVITLEYPEFFLVCAYVPNSQDGLRRLDYRMTWEDDFRNYLLALDQKKPVIVCGDMNVAHQEIDLKNPKTNRMNAGFTDQEQMRKLYALDMQMFLNETPCRPSNDRYCLCRFIVRHQNFTKFEQLVFCKCIAAKNTAFNALVFFKLNDIFNGQSSAFNSTVL